MSKIVFIGGIGSNIQQAAYVADMLSKYYKKPVEGIPFSHTWQNPEDFRKKVHKALVITHSAGMLVLNDTSPQRVIAIAPPLPRTVFYLLKQTFLKTVRYIQASRHDIERKKRVVSYHNRAFKENLFNIKNNVGHAGEISKFDSVKVAYTLAQEGIEVVMVSMQNDLLFSDMEGHALYRVAQEKGVRFVTNVAGEHDEFLLYPFETIQIIEERLVK